MLPWLEKHPLQALELSVEWPRLLAVVTWLVERPRPGIYLRQVDLPGVHNKFIETHRGVLAELLDLALPVDAVDIGKTGISQFPARYGFLDQLRGHFDHVVSFLMDRCDIGCACSHLGK